MLIAFHKPYGVLSQFTAIEGRETLADFIGERAVYPAGRLDHDSEGLLLLTDDGPLQHAIADPANALAKRYLAQVEGVPDDRSLARFADGLDVGSGHDRFRARPATARSIAAPDIADRDPPIRVRERIPTAWIEVTVVEGRNRQVRRMTAAIGHPTLRLLRVGVGSLDLFALGLLAGMSIEVEPARLSAAFAVGSAGGSGRRVRASSPGRPVSTGFRDRRYGE